MSATEPIPLAAMLRRCAVDALRLAPSQCVPWILVVPLVGSAAAQEGSSQDRSWVPTRRVALEFDVTALSPDVQGRPQQPCSVPSGLDATYAPKTTWSGGTVPFEFDGNTTAGQQNAAIAAMNVVQPLADVTFVPRNGEDAFLRFQDSTTNSSSSIGSNGGQVTISIFNWNVQGIIVHEILHALGFHHEQQRPDRNNYVQVVTGNIQQGQEHNFSLERGAGTAGPYDFGSLMHYGQCAFSNCTPCPGSCETLLALPPYQSFQSTMGQRAAMSTLDVHGLRSIYPEPTWRFVDPSNPNAGTGSGVDPWRQLSSALGQAPASSRVFVMPGAFSAQGTWSRPVTLEAPIGGVVVR